MLVVDDVVHSWNPQPHFSFSLARKETKILNILWCSMEIDVMFSFSPYKYFFCEIVENLRVDVKPIKLSAIFECQSLCVVGVALH